MKTLVALYLLISCEMVFAQTMPKGDMSNEAINEAVKTFSKYHAVCNSKVVVRIGRSDYFEFSGNKADVGLLGTYRISEADKLNGKLWNGKIEVDMGDAARRISIDSAGNKTVSEWEYGREAEFNFAYSNGQWDVTGTVKTYTNTWYDLVPDVSCTNLNL